jgi:hypothetical protein
MAIWDYSAKGGLWTGVAITVGLIAAPALVPLAESVVRPVLKSVLKGGFMLYEQGHELVTGIAEGTVDLIEEAKSEVRG